MIEKAEEILGELGRMAVKASVWGDKAPGKKKWQPVKSRVILWAKDKIVAARIVWKEHRLEPAYFTAEWRNCNFIYSCHMYQDIFTAEKESVL